MRNKKLINGGNDITQGWQFCKSLINRLGKGRGKKRKKKVIYTTRGIRICSPSQVLTPRNKLRGRNMLLSLWYSNSSLNAFLKFVR